MNKYKRCGSIAAQQNPHQVRTLAQALEGNFAGAGQALEGNFAGPGDSRGGRLRWFNCLKILDFSFE